MKLTRESLADIRKMINLAVLVDPEWAMEVLRLAEWALEHQEESVDCDCGQPYDVDDWTCHDPFQGKLKSEVFESLRQVTAEFNKIQGQNQVRGPENRDDPPSTVKSRNPIPDFRGCDHHHGEKKAKVEGASPRTPTNSDGIHGKVPNSGSEPERDRKYQHEWTRIAGPDGTIYRCEVCSYLTLWPDNVPACMGPEAPSTGPK